MATFHYIPLHSSPHGRAIGATADAAGHGPRGGDAAAAAAAPAAHGRRGRRGSWPRSGRPARERRRRPPYLSLVLACYNEAEHLEASFAEIRETLEQTSWPFEVIFVDDESRDRTPEILRAIVAAHPELDLRLILHERNRGRGATVTRRLPRRPGRDRRLPRHRPRGPLPLHPGARAGDRGGRRHRDGPTHLRLPAPLARPLPHEPRLLLARAPPARPALPRHRDRLQVLPPRDGAAAARRDRGRRLVLGHRVHGPRRPPRAAGRGDPRRLHPARGQDLDRAAACATRVRYFGRLLRFRRRLRPSGRR